MIYLDSSALVKLARVEPDTAALRTWLMRYDSATRVTSDVAAVEVPRAVMRIEPHAVLRAHHIVARTQRISLTRDLLSSAAALRPTTLRSLDAIHLASALSIADTITAFVAYDKRLVQAAADTGLPIVSPN